MSGMNPGREQRQVRISFGGSLTPVVRTLIAINALIYVLLWLVRGRQTPELFTGPMELQGLLIQLLGLVPRSVTHNLTLWQPVTYMFLHQEFWHLLLNMLGLWWFGADVERYMGGRGFLRYYLLAGIGGALAAVAVSWNSPMVTIGASGAIFGVLVAYGFLFPNRVIYLYFLIPVRAVWCVAIFAAVTLYSLFKGSPDGVSHIAHLGGMIFGIVWFLLARNRTRLTIWIRTIRKRRLRSRFRLVRRNDLDDQPPFDSYNNKTLH